MTKPRLCWNEGVSPFEMNSSDGLSLGPLAWRKRCVMTSDRSRATQQLLGPDSLHVFGGDHRLPVRLLGLEPLLFAGFSVLLALFFPWACC